ncbi:MAG: UDP-N-acetylmuramoyl-tripeptide--D-alanyl-D-alanine ligase [Clostridiales bacterium]|jgi:UDP-N-acetylmuramoyl-tripeptide--D-alanyl-D-alanine ligase|nr:UDP-N-acetylmuramoyl-tripeptide--D-alanyl-D-alanine ligase [Clostridiales bacterium]
MRALNLDEIAWAVGGRLNNGDYNGLSINGVSTDTRSLNAGELFVAVEGPNFDGHSFIDQAFNKGAACVLAHKYTAADKPVITVNDTRKALLDLAAYYISLFEIKTIAVTGSVGKTTAKDLIASVLSRRFRVLKTQGNLNNDIGLPLTVFGIEDDTDIAVLEMGMSAEGEIRALSMAARPDAAVITNIGVSHMETLGSREAILRAKCEVFAGMGPGGAVFLNGGDELLRAADTAGLKTTHFGLTPDCDVTAENIKKLGLTGVSFTLCGKDFKIDAAVNMPGTHTVINALAASAVGLSFGLSPEEIRDGLLDFKPTVNRLNIKEALNGAVIIDDVYNASPDSVKAALEVLTGADGRKICVLGDMMELGPQSALFHEEAGCEAARLGINIIICVGERSRDTFTGAHKEIESGRSKSVASYFPDKKIAAAYLSGLLKKGDTVLVKASRAMAFEDIVKEIIH